MELILFGMRVGEDPKQNLRRDCMAPGGTVKVLLATRPRALLRSTLTVPPSAMVRR
jgi:hypothetical protein